MAELFTALAYYYEHRGEFLAQEQEFAAARRDGVRRIQGLPKEVESTERAE